MTIIYSDLLKALKNKRHKAIIDVINQSVPHLVINLIWLANQNCIAVILSFINTNSISDIIEFIAIRCNMRFHNLGSQKDLEYIRCNKIYFIPKHNVDFLVEQLSHPDVIHNFHCRGIQNIYIVLQAKRHNSIVCLENKRLIQKPLGV